MTATTSTNSWNRAFWRGPICAYDDHLCDHGGVGSSVICIPNGRIFSGGEVKLPRAAIDQLPCACRQCTQPRAGHSRGSSRGRCPRRQSFAATNKRTARLQMIVLDEQLWQMVIFLVSLNYEPSNTASSDSTERDQRPGDRRTHRGH